MKILRLDLYYYCCHTVDGEDGSPQATMRAHTAEEIEPDSQVSRGKFSCVVLFSREGSTPPLKVTSAGWVKLMEKQQLE